MNKVINTLLVLFSICLMLFMLTSLWGWFVVPLGVKSIGYAHMFGLCLFITYFQVRNPKIFKPEVLVSRTFRQRIGFNIGLMTTATLLGYIASLFV